ncbi:hypothetical protein [Levilactobacillus tujiorum]|uniref:ABC transmembrane type-1 domain-containing protein n=1 Tax=Levilactobacillus tujiorum TaxID=2912243 RepID=A0ABX1L7E6_9LACO|nr:hypothetical protein [Levilactobacillus tujiorum]MCH5465242.1 hypothetical protein [Levilactobacillus tujiorum]NLR12531.1 hypothetical protein [Lactobacillus sp. HBUAS51387]NLR30199.1 hypothetical protein [Levilactobacillus tujiorum]NLR31761.1 hypothetical protein [Levilactobacillus tujiorum]
MSHREVIAQLKKVVLRLRWLNILQLVPDTLLVYSIIQLAFSGQLVTLFNATFNRREAILVTVMFALIDICVTGIRYNDRVAGKRLISQLTGQLTAPEVNLIKRFENLK